MVLWAPAWKFYIYYAKGIRFKLVSLLPSSSIGQTFYLFVYYYYYYRFTYLKGIVAERVNHLLLHSPNSHNGPGWPRLKPWAYNFIWISYNGSRAQVLGPSSCAFWELDKQWDSWDSSLCSYGMCAMLCWPPMQGLAFVWTLTPGIISQPSVACCKIRESPTGYYGAINPGNQPQILLATGCQLVPVKSRCACLTPGQFDYKECCPQLSVVKLSDLNSLFLF